MNALDSELAERLAGLRGQALCRELRRVDSPQGPRIRVGERMLLNFSSNDYLGLANDEALKQAAVEAVERYGAGAGSARLICGSLAAHHDLEETLAAFKGTEAALAFSSGYLAALGTIGALVGRDDVVVLDRLAHSCLIDAARLSGAKLRVFHHNDLGDLERILRYESKVQSPKSKVEGSETGNVSTTPTSDFGLRTSDFGPPTIQIPRSRRVLIVTESVFSMDGDFAPLRELVEVKERYGAWLMVDEAHATGLYGAHGRGLAEALGAAQSIEVQMGTLGKALGSAGGYTCGSRTLIDYLINRARTFVFSTAPVPAATAAAAAAIRFVQSEAGNARRDLLWQRVAELSSRLTAEGGGGAADEMGLGLAIQPLRIGGETEAVEAATALLGAGIFVPAIRYPTVGRGQARLRVTLTAAHKAEDVEQLVRALRQLNLDGLTGGAVQ